MPDEALNWWLISCSFFQPRWDSLVDASLFRDPCWGAGWHTRVGFPLLLADLLEQLLHLCLLLLEQVQEQVCTNSIYLSKYKVWYCIAYTSSKDYSCFLRQLKAVGFLIMILFVFVVKLEPFWVCVCVLVRIHSYQELNQKFQCFLYLLI